MARTDGMATTDVGDMTDVKRSVSSRANLIAAIVTDAARKTKTFGSTGKPDPSASLLQMTVS